MIKIIYANDKKYLIDIFNVILSNKNIPDRWKYGKLIFFAKPNRKIKSPSDYRPITLLNNLCKIAEELIIKGINEKLNATNYFSDLQFGFKKNTSTVDALNSMITNAKKKRKTFKKCILMCLDISSAFDAIKWKKIVGNLLRADLDRELIIACQNLLKNRKVIFNNKIIETKRGTPQGGKESPSLWKIGMNDLLKKLGNVKRVHTVAYADDIGMLIFGDNKAEIQEKINVTINLVNKWCTEAGVKLNVNKTEIINLSKSKKNLNIKIIDKEIKFKPHLKYLGIVIDDKLLFNRHLDQLQSKTLNLLEQVRRLLWMNGNIKFRYKLKLYHSLFMSKICYASQIWFNEVSSKKTYRQRLSRVQRKIMLAITGAYWYRSTSNIKLLNLLMLNDIKEELIIRRDTNELVKEIRKEARSELSRMYLESREGTEFFDDISDFSSRFFF